MSERQSDSGTGPAEGNAADQGRQLAGASQKGRHLSPMPKDVPRAEKQLHVSEAEKIQAELIRRMTPARRLEIARELYETAWQLKEAGLRRQHPEWSEQEIWSKCRRVFVTGYAGA